VRRHAYDLRLTSSEAVVLFELLHRMQEHDRFVLDTAERDVTDSLLRLLESALTERVERGYAEMVERAKRSLPTTPA
jgi:hypothetical protein